MKRVSFLLIIFLFILACSHNPVWVKFDSIESYAKERPDSARAQLLAMDQELLNTPSLRARYALMLTTANSRCKIKEQDDSLINVAVKYYSKWGPKKEKFLAYYYQGRIYENSKSYENALKSYIQAEDNISESLSVKYLSSLYLHKGYIYSTYYAIDKAIKAYQNAGDYALKGDWHTNYVLSIIASSKAFLINKQPKQIDSCLVLLDSVIDRENVTDFQNYLTIKLHYLAQIDSPKDSILLYADSLLSIRPYLNKNSLINLAIAYNLGGKTQLACQLLNQYKNRQHNAEEENRYQFALYRIKDSLKEYEESLRALEKTMQITGFDVYDRFRKDTLFIEEREINTREKNWIVIVSFIGGSVLLIVLGLLAFLLKKRKKEKRQIDSLLDDIKAEKESLIEILHENERIQGAARVALGNRISSLAQFLAKDKPQSLSQVNSQLEALTENRKELLDTIGLLYAIYYPDAISVLINKGLSTAEVGYCCLLQLGFRTKEIGDVINRSGSYNISSAIRKKLGLGPNDTNLSNYIKGLFESNNT